MLPAIFKVYSHNFSELCIFDSEIFTDVTLFRFCNSVIFEGQISQYNYNFIVKKQYMSLLQIATCFPIENHHLAKTT